MASKDKGGKAAKTSASKSLKEKRADKKEKKVRRSEHRTTQLLHTVRSAQRDYGWTLQTCSEWFVDTLNRVLVDT